MAEQNLHSGGTWMVFHQCEAFHTLSVRHSVQKSCHSGGNWMVFHECEAFHALSGRHSVQKSCHSGGTSIFFLNFSTWLNFTDWMSDLNGNKCMNASEQQIVMKKRTTKSHRNPRFFCPLLRAVDYWELLLNKNFRKQGFVHYWSALLRALSVLVQN